MTRTDSGPRLIVALDYPDTAGAEAMAARLPPESCRLKIGKELFTRGGPALVEALQRRGFQIFLDLKFHDIPHTVAQACRAAADLGVWMVNVHALGGRAMLTAAREEVDKAAQPPRLIAVTVLTSLEQHDLEETGIAGSLEDEVVRLACLAQHCGLDGVVCSAREARSLRLRCGPDFCLVTPGIRPAGAGTQDQRRTHTPAEAIGAGADYLVIGRPITQAQDPVKALEAISAEVAAAVHPPLVPGDGRG
jgi:orotidine-5'-phosphate decarboxylase